MSTSEEYKDLAKCKTVQGEIAFAHFLEKGGYIFIQWSDSEECWDYYLFDDEGAYVDGGQFESDGDGNKIWTAFDAIAMVASDDKGIYDIDDDDEVEFLDPDDGFEMLQESGA